jgi:hypothetical protein
MDEHPDNVPAFVSPMDARSAASGAAALSRLVRTLAAGPGASHAAGQGEASL